MHFEFSGIGDEARKHGKPGSKEYSSAYGKLRRRRIWQLVAEYKARPCSDCGGSFPPCAMDLHHRDPGDKEFVLGQAALKSWKRVRAEMDKCDLVCANCHRIRHFKERRGDAWDAPFTNPTDPFELAM